MNLKGLIYCRVSSAKQVKEGNGLSSQEKRCRDYAENTLGISIEKVFNDEGVSGGVFERKSIQELFKYIDENKSQSYIVVFEDLNRLSRDIQVHSLLKAEFNKRNVELACPNFQFEESPEGDFKENISVVVAQYEKDKTQNIEKNFLQTRNVGTLLKSKLKTVSNLHYIWNNSDLKKKQELVKMVFPAGISINKKRGVGTPTLSLIYQAFELSKTSKIQLVEQHIPVSNKLLISISFKK